MQSETPAPSAPETLLARARAGDRAALEALLADIAPAVHRFGLRMCGNPSDADDILQDTLVNMVQHLDGYAVRASLSSWAFALARSACTRRRRGLKNRPPEPAGAEHADPAPSPEARASERELGDALGRALASLGPEYREVLLLRDVEELSAREAADALGVSEAALKSRLHRARAALRDRLAPAFAPAPASAPVPVSGGRARGCPDVVALWSQKLDGDLSAVDCEAMERHVASCADCADACDRLKRALVACRSVRASAVPPAVQDRVKIAVRAYIGLGR